MRAILTGGGTGGHIYPALAIADKICLEFEGAEILYIGTPGSLEEKIVTKYGYAFETVQVKGFQRKLSLENLKRGFKALKAIHDAKKIIKNFKPNIVIGTGGYVAGPVVYAASRCSVPTLIHEQNAYPGVTNRILSKKADKIYLGFEAARTRFKTKAPMETIGNPVRSQILNSHSREEARKILNILPEEKFILITGGSSGSEAINNVIIETIPEFINQNIAFIFSTGTHHYEAIANKFAPLLKENKFIITEYIEDMANYIAASDLCVISAGATTIAEINAVGRASIIIPKAYSAENHQEVNAKNIHDNGAGYYIRENDITKEKLLSYVNSILNNEKIKNEMEINSKKLYPEDPCKTIVEDIHKMIK